MDLKKLLRGEGYAQIFHRLENCWGGGMPTNFIDLKKCWWGGGGGYANKFCVWILKKNLGGGVVMPKYFIDLKKCLGGGGYAAVCQNILGIWKKCW